MDNTNQVGLSEEMQVQDGEKLFILMKDFKCLDEVSEISVIIQTLADKLK